MPVQIPRLNRFEPQQTQSVGRSEIQAPNLAAIAQPQMNAVMGIAEQQVNYFQKQEDYAIDTAAKAAANEYNIYLNQELNKARQFQGDPTKVYAQFDEARAKKYEEILNKNPDISDRGKGAIAGELSQVASSYQIKRDTAYSGQYYDYDKNVTKDAANIKAQDLMSAAAYIDPTNPETFKPIDALINGIAMDYKNHGEKFGAVIRDEAGNQVATDGINLEIGETVSKGLESAINNLNDSGRPDIADALYAKYYKYIDASKQDKIKKSIFDEQTNVRIENVVEQTIGKGTAAIDKIIDKAFKDNPSAKKKAWEAIDTRNRQIENIQERNAKRSYQYLANLAFEKQSSDKPFVSIYEMENDPNFKKTIRALNPTQRTALQRLVAAPKESNSEAVIKYHQALKDNKFSGMPVEDMVELKAGLNKKDGNTVEVLWKKYNSPKTTAEETRMMNNLTSKLDEQLQAVGYVKKVNGFYSNVDQMKITDATNELVAEMDRFPPNMRYDDQIKYLQGFASAKAKGEVFKPTNEAPATPPPPATSGKSPFDNTQTLNDRDRRANAVRLFFRANKRGPNPGELEDFIKKEKL